MKLNIKYLDNYVGEPLSYATPGSAGFDLRAAISNKIELWHNDNIIVPCGFSVAIPEGYEMQIRPRSGLAAKYGVTVTNSPGTIDSDYRGEIKVILYRLSVFDGIGEALVINPGDRIAQAVISPINQVELISVDTLEDTERSSGGFGSSGVQ